MQTIVLEFYSETLGGHNVTTGASTEDSRVKAEEIKAKWKSLWQSHIDDKVRAEGIADQCFPLLFVEQSTEIGCMNRKLLVLKEILVYFACLFLCLDFRELFLL